MKTLNILKYLFALIGAGLLVGAFMSYNSTASFIERSTEAWGTVVDLERSRSSDSTTYYPVVVFEDVMGQQIEFRSRSGSNPPAFSRGETVSVFYESSEPESARINSFFSLWGLSVILGGLGLVFGAIGGGMVLFGLLKGRSKAYLKDHGTEVLATFSSVERNTALTVNGRNPFRIICQWQHPQTGELHVFRSENLWFDPSQHIHQETVPVLVDEANLKRYWVDTSFLPKMAS
ncbi:DUF3592 domain-containing protein [Marinobacter daepoensis]|uniref:DUF3592 domain-containing protein n=2 Tax=Marinobacter daepoensis TaxID=262077 RepID=A0ABS3BLM6_9GAMM|nr:DUF3592 domain-containing protein [Marinobacter daepoensis]MBN7771627.1 DUF3592 domain-containing protein [Marinobacter daepoensis]MBY6034966.1 DUF3592 domain-containing protein [Marinobacter daepoensis]MBY6080926.1 DUF3592 domain-containing protein [Marinobacter daepoensis]